MIGELQTKIYESAINVYLSLSLSFRLISLSPSVGLVIGPSKNNRSVERKTRFKPAGNTQSLLIVLYPFCINLSISMLKLHIFSRRISFKVLLSAWFVTWGWTTLYCTAVLFASENSIPQRF